MIRIEAVNGLAELERFGWDFEPAGSDEVKFKCPVHEDRTPSATLNVKKNLWLCHSSECNAKGDIVSLLSYIAKCKRETMFASLIDRYPSLQECRTVRQDVVEKHHAAIWKSGPLLQALYDRGITDENIREHRLGFHNNRIIIPIYDQHNRVVNLRKYLPGAPGPEKMLNLKGYTTTAPYPVAKIYLPVLWICGGEMKAIIANHLLNKHNVGAFCITAGEGAWKKEFNQHIKDKIIYICMDVDAGGRTAALKVARQIHTHAQSVFIIRLPLDLKKYPKGDINDYVANEGATDKDLLKLMQEADRFSLKEEEEKDKQVIECELIHAAIADNIGRQVEFDGMVSALDTIPFIVPKTVGVICTKDTDGCTSCDIYVREPDEETGEIKYSISPTNPFLLDMVNVPKRLHPDFIRGAFGAKECKKCQIRVKDYYNIYDSRLTSPLNVHSDNTQHIFQAANLVASKSPELNIPYRMHGRPFADPKTSQATLLIDKIDEREDTLSSYKFLKKDLTSLRKFQPKTWSVDSLTEKLDDIYEDLTTNVTRIFYRQRLHLSIDICYHSPLYFAFDGRVQHGWINCLITGDSSQGKSEATIRLIEHYRLGTRHDCKNASEAGLLGGLQQMGTRWFVSWGVIPLHDRQLVVMEEIKGASTKVLGRLTDMRSSGFAEITKIEHRKAHARTRLIMISNPRSDRPISAYTFGIETVKELMGSLEDVRRFDFVTIVSEVEIDADLINETVANTPVKNPKYTSDLCRRLILWSWTRTADQVQFTDEAKACCLTLSSKICKMYSETIPICDKGTMRYKLARLSAALACRTFSTDNKESLIIRKCHVEYMAQFLDDGYRLPHVGYKAFSEAESYSSILKDTNLIRRGIVNTKYPKDLVDSLLHSDSVTLNDIMDWCSMQRDSAQSILSLFVRKRALFRNDREYVKSPGFITFLKSLSAEDLKDNADDNTEF